MKLRNELINSIEEGLDNKAIIVYLFDLGFKEAEILEELKDNDNEDITKENFTESALNKLREKIQSNNNFYKDINKHDIISHLSHVQNAHVKASNEAYRFKSNLKELKQWVTEEMNKAELSANIQIDLYVKGVFLGQKLSFERILREMEEFKYE
jgi:hypothetical protein